MGTIFLLFVLHSSREEGPAQTPARDGPDEGLPVGVQDPDHERHELRQVRPHAAVAARDQATAPHGAGSLCHCPEQSLSKSGVIETEGKPTIFLQKDPLLRMNSETLRCRGAVVYNFAFGPQRPLKWGRKSRVEGGANKNKT